MKIKLRKFIKQYLLSLVLVLMISISLLALFTIALINNDGSTCTDRIYEAVSSTHTTAVTTCAVPSLFDRIGLAILPVIIGIFILLVISLLAKGARSQIVHKAQWSWFRLLIYVLSFSLLFAAFQVVNKHYKVILLAIEVLYGVVLLFLFIYLRFNKNKILESTFQFANGTVGRGDNDILGFTPSADNFGRGLRQLHLPVHVIAITGGMGSGKSTFWRITAEGFDKESTMHTYISLTETNSSNDFTKLFAARWFLSLKQRYAILLSPDYIEQSRLFRVLRDGSHGLLSILIEAGLSINVGIFRTRTQIIDQVSEIKNRPFVDKDTAILFGNIPEIYEKQWYIVIDELERSPIEEVYRVIEVIERFKQMGKNGLPVQLIFVLCYDVDYFENQKSGDKDGDSWLEKTRLVQNFLTNNNRKSIDIVQRVPKSSINARIHLITERIKSALSVLPKNAFDTNKYRLLDGLYEDKKDDFKDITPQLAKYSHDLNSKELFDFLILRMVDLPPRSTVRLVAELRFNMSAVDQKAKEEWLLNTSLSTFLGMEYMRVIRPELWQFIENAFLKFDPDLKSFYTMYNHWTIDKDNDKRTDREKIYENTGIDTSIYSDQELASIMEDLNTLVPVVAKFILTGEDPYENNVTQYSGTLSDPDNLRWIIAYNYGERTNFGTYAQLYLQVKQLRWPIELADADTIKDFSSFVRNRIGYSDKTREASLFIAKNILNFIETSKNLYEPSTLDFEQNNVDKVTYEFVFQIQEAVFIHEASEENRKQGTELFDAFIHSNKVPFEAKLIALDAFLNESGTGFERVRTREEVFEKYMGDMYFPQLYAEMVKGMFELYGKPRSPINVYNHEANFFYVLYQTWDGVPNSQNLATLRVIAHKGLTNNTKALEALWSVYPYTEGLKTYKDLTSNLRNFGSTEMTPARRGLFVTLEAMLRFSQTNRNFREVLKQNRPLKDKVTYWLNVFKEGTYTKEESELQPTNDTVGAKMRNLTSRKVNINFKEDQAEA